MNTDKLAILIVDDTKFSSAIVSKTLSAAGYTDIRTSKSAQDALELIKERPIDILLADWMMPEMDGLELTRHIRELDEAAGLYTYIILLTAKDGTENFSLAFEAGIDDFINKSMMKEQLVPKFMATSRLVRRQNHLLNENKALRLSKHKLEIINTVDPLTGIGNLKYALARLQDTLNFVDSRGGALCYLHFSIVDFETLKKNHRQNTIDQLIVNLTNRIQQLVRPMDGICRIGPEEFGVIQHQNSLDICQGKIFKRIMDGVNLKAFETDTGFISLKIAISLIGVDNKQEFLPNPETVIEEARKHLKPDNAGVEINTSHWSTLKD